MKNIDLQNAVIQTFQTETSILLIFKMVRRFPTMSQYIVQMCIGHIST